MTSEGSQIGEISHNNMFQNNKNNWFPFKMIKSVFINLNISGKYFLRKRNRDRKLNV